MQKRILRVCTSTFQLFNWLVRSLGERLRANEKSRKQIKIHATQSWTILFRTSKELVQWKCRSSSRYWHLNALYPNHIYLNHCLRLLQQTKNQKFFINVGNKLKHTQHKAERFCSGPQKSLFNESVNHRDAIDIWMPSIQLTKSYILKSLFVFLHTVLNATSCNDASVM